MPGRSLGETALRGHQAGRIDEALHEWHWSLALLSLLASFRLPKCCLTMIRRRADDLPSAVSAVLNLRAMNVLGGKASLSAGWRGDHCRNSRRDVRNGPGECTAPRNGIRQRTRRE